MIELAFQNWNVEYGWWAPNTVPGDFVYDGKKQAPLTHGTQWFDISTHYHPDRQAALSAPALKNDFLYTHRNIRYTHLPELQEKKYIYPVMIRDTRYFYDNKDIGFSYVDSKVIEDVKANRARIVLMFPLEGTSGDEPFKEDFVYLNKWCSDKGLTRDQVYYICGNHKSPSLSDGMNFTAIPINHFLCWVPALRQQPANFNPNDGRDLFLSYNRRPRPHRTLLLCELIRNKLLDRGLVSYYGDNVKDTAERVKKYDRPGLGPEAQILDTLIPLEIDMDLGTNNPAWNIEDEHYSRTFCSVVPETLYDNNVIFFSEKTWKTIAVGHPFMLLSSPGMLAKLREMGYYTYGSFWDEGYDTLKTVGGRARHIANELKRLGSFSRDQLVNMRADMQPMIEHNQRLFNKQWKEHCSEHEYRQLYRIVESIWNSF